MSDKPDTARAIKQPHNIDPSITLARHNKQPTSTQQRHNIN